MKLILFVLIVLAIYKVVTALRKKYTTPVGETYDFFSDVLKQPHTLIAGTTGSGKSVVINGLISTLLYRAPVDKANGAQLILIDPKRVELADYKDMPHTLAHAAGFNPEAWIAALEKAVEIMDARYAKMERMRVKEYKGGDLYVIIDEWANVFMNGGKYAYKLVMRLTSEGRAAHVRVIMATQVPSTKIIPSEVRENFNSRICLRTASKLESRVIMNMNGCELLPAPKDVGYANGYYIKNGTYQLYTMPYVQQNELDRLTSWWRAQA